MRSWVFSCDNYGGGPAFPSPCGNCMYENPAMLDVVKVNFGLVAIDRCKSSHVGRCQGEIRA